MDSLTQIALGAAVGSAVAGRQLGRKAALWGAVCGTLPDLDVFINFGGPVEDFTYHRGFSHSLFVLLLLTPLLAWLIGKLHPGAAHRNRRLLLVGLVLISHPLLDAFTVYGTQLLWPLTEYPFGWSSIFIIDPFYTLPLLIGVLAALLLRRNAWGYRLNVLGLALSSAYLAWGLAAKLYVEDVARDTLAAQHLSEARLLTGPTPFNTVLWRVLAVTEEHYYDGYYSLLDEQPVVDLRRYPRSPELLDGLRQHWPVARLAWFSKGFYAARRQHDDVIMTDLRMGLEPDYVFQFKVAEFANPHPHPVPAEQLQESRDFSRMSWLWQRIWGKPAN